MIARVLRCIAVVLCVLPALAQGEAVTRYETDGVGNRTAMIRPNGERWEYGYDAANRLETVTSPEGAVTTYAYNRADHLIQTTDAEGRITQTPVDALGRITRRTYANGDVETFDTYDASNNLTLRHDGNGQAIESTYDALERLTRRTYGGPAEPTDIVEESWEYDPDGRWTLGTQRAQDGTVYTTRRTYDRQSRLDDETDRYGQVTDHVYDPQDNRVGRTDPEGDTVFQPDRLNRLRSVQPENESALAIEYTPAGRIKTHTYPNGATTSHAYDIAGRVETITHRQHGVVTATFTYAYDLNGNRKTETHVAPLGTRTTTYFYDRDDRLTETHLTDEAGVVTDTIYTLDRVGNRKTEVVSQGATQLASITYTYNARHQLTRDHDSISDLTTTRLYDGNGFMTSETTNGQTTTYRPNLQGRLATLTTPTGPPVHYSYDLDGHRVEKRTTAEATRYGYDGAQLRRETNVVNNLLASYDWASGRVLRTRRSNQTSYAQHDALKSPIRWSRADGGEQARAMYGPWGDLSTSTGVLPPIGYTGYYADAESSLYYAQQRYYSPKLGRFTRIDPWAGDVLNPVTLNKYLYANANPLVYVDPTGMYGEAGHYYTTYYVALKVGYSDAEAQQLAIYSQLPDEAAALDAISVQKHAINRFDSDAAAERRDMAQIGLHALSGGNAQFETQRTLSAIAKAGNDLTTTGLLIHRLGDSFAHRNTSEYGGESGPARVRMFETGAGHATPAYAPDTIQRRPELYLQYVDTLTTALAEKRGLTHQQQAKLQESVRGELREVAYSSGVLPAGGLDTRTEDTALKGRSVSELSTKINILGYQRLGTGREAKGFVDNDYRPENFEGDENSLLLLDQRKEKSVEAALNEILGSSALARSNSAAYASGEAMRGVGRASELVGGAMRSSDDRGEPRTIHEAPDATSPPTIWETYSEWWND